MSRNVGKIVSSILRHENGTCASGSSFCCWQAKRRWPLLSGICCLQGRAGKINSVTTLLYLNEMAKAQLLDQIKIKIKLYLCASMATNAFAIIVNCLLDKLFFFLGLSRVPNYLSNSETRHSFRILKRKCVPYFISSLTSTVREIFLHHFFRKF